MLTAVSVRVYECDDADIGRMATHPEQKKISWDVVAKWQERIP